MARPTPEHQQKLRGMAYLLRILENGAPHPVPGNPVAGRDGVFVLPIPPQALQGDQAGRFQVLPTRAWNVADVQGLEAPVWTIEGTFLLTPVSVRGVRLSAYGWARALEGFLRYFLEENRKRGEAKRPLLTLEWHDFYRDEHWEVLPKLLPLSSQSASQPLLERYRLQLIGVRPVGAAPRPPDPVIERVKGDPNAALAQLCPLG